MSKRKLEDEALAMAMEGEKSSSITNYYGNIAHLIAQREIEGPYYRARKVLLTSLDETLNNSNKSDVFISKKANLGRIYQQIHSNHMWISRLKLFKVLKKHAGCVNTVAWNADGSLLLTGSDDFRLNLWNGPPHYKLRKTLFTGHHRNIFSAVFVPFSGDKEIVSCGMDGEIRWADVNDEKSAKLIATYNHMAYKIWFLPNSNTSFVVTHQDGQVRMYDLRTKETGDQNIIVKLKNGRKTISANSLAFSLNNPNIFALGGADAQIRLFDIRANQLNKEANSIRSYCPKHLIDKKSKNDFDSIGITGVDFNNLNEIAVTYSKEDVYTFNASDAFVSEKTSDNGVVHTFDMQFSGRRNVQTFLKEVSFLGNNSYVATGCDSGNLFIWDKITGKLVQMLRADDSVVNGVAPHPTLPIVASCGIDPTTKIFEVSDEITFDSKRVTSVLEDNKGHKDETLGDSTMLRHLYNLISRLRRQRQEGGDVEPEEFEADDYMESEEGEDEDRELSEEDSAVRLAVAAEIRARANEAFKEMRYVDALEEYDEAIQELDFKTSSEQMDERRNASKLTCLLNTAACCLKLEDYDRVIEDCSVVLGSQPDSLKALYRRGAAYFHKNQLEQAKEDLKKAVEIAPDDTVVKNLLKQVEEKLVNEDPMKKMFSGLFK